MKMDMMAIWNFVLTGLVGMLGFLIKGRFEDLQRISELLNKTREEIARDHITRSEFRDDMQQLIGRFDRLERKIDAMKTRCSDDTH